MIPVYEKNELKKAEQEGMVADCMQVRLKLIERVHTGEITLEQAQSELRQIKRLAHGNGLYTREDIASGKNVDLQHHLNLAREKQKNKLDKNLPTKPIGKIHKV